MSSGCGCKEVYISSYYLSLLLLYLLFFCSSIPTFGSFLKCFSFLFQYIFVINPRCACYVLLLSCSISRSFSALSGL